MSPSDHDLLLKLHTKFDNLAEEFRRVSNGVGFPRCAERLVRLDGHDEDIKTLHKRIDNGNSRFWWLITFVITQTVAFVLGILKGVIKV